MQMQRGMQPESDTLITCIKGEVPGAESGQGEGTVSADAVMKCSLVELKWNVGKETPGKSGQQSPLRR